jgi:cellulose synthase/poly-beta-1,6-N-acetylglucosamine synthase-like glycosyltransferase
MNAIEHVIAWGFWTCATAVAYAYAGYPALIYLLSRVFGQDPVPPEARDEDLPRVSLLIVAHNEEAVIAERLENALLTDYPPNKREIVVACDGCSDATASIARRYAFRGARLLDERERRGKAATLNRSIPQLDGEIVVLSDANTRFDPSAVRSLVRWFADPRVGVACGRLRLTDAATGQNADGVYWAYETFLKRCEARLGALLGANGAIYAIRRELFVPIPDGTIIDDFLIPLAAKLDHGCTIVYDHAAVAREETAPNVESEFRRRARIGAGGFQTLGRLAPLLDPRRGWTALAFASHKLLRWCCPFFMIGALACSAVLLRIPLYRAAMEVQLAFYAASGLAPLWPARRKAPRALRAAQLFTGMNAALLVGFWRWWNDAQTATWTPTARVIEERRAA